MSDSSQPELGTTSADIMASVSRGTIGMVPVVGSLVAEIVGNVIPNQRIERITRFVLLLESRLKHLEGEVLRVTMTAPPAVDLLEDAFVQAARATNEERLEHIANAVAYGLSSDEKSKAEAKRMLWLVGQLNDAEIIILRGALIQTREDANADAEFRKRHEDLLAPDSTHLGSSDVEIEEMALKKSYGQRLQELGLIRMRFTKPRRGELPEFDGDTGMMKASGTKVTRLGRMLLRYLNLVPTWCTQ
jgi:hypothetical protein